ASFDVVNIAASFHRAHVDGEIGVRHLVFERVLQLVRAGGGVKEKLVVFVVVERPEERDTLNMVPVKVRKKDVRVKRTVIKLVDQLFPQNAEAGAAVEDVEVAADAHLDAGCVPAIAKIFRLRRGR